VNVIYWKCGKHMHICLQCAMKDDAGFGMQACMFRQPTPHRITS